MSTGNILIGGGFEAQIRDDGSIAILHASGGLYMAGLAESAMVREIVALRAEVARAVAEERAKHAEMRKALLDYFEIADAAWVELCQEATKNGIKSVPILPGQAKALDHYNAMRRDFGPARVDEVCAQAHGQTPGSALD